MRHNFLGHPINSLIYIAFAICISAALFFWSIDANIAYFIQGCTVQVHTLDGHIYDGVLDAISPNVSTAMSLRYFY